jgi:nucleotide-binding universal stress UspA family protein
MRTIVIADALMGLDNVLAVAGAAHGSYLLVVLGLLISVPVVVWGSTLVLKWVERYPAIVYAGAAVLCLTAAKMVLAEPLLKPVFAASPLLGVLPYLSIPLVLWLGFVRNHRQLESRIHARLADMAPLRPAGESTVAGGGADHARPAAAAGAALFLTTPQGDLAMLKVLVPVDGAGNSLAAVHHAMAEYRRHHELELHLLNVQPRLSRHISRWVARRNRDDFYAEQAGSALAQARALLDNAGIPHHSHWRVGERADEICRSATELGVHHIVMGTARKNSITRMLEDSTTNAVLEKTPVPVEVVAGAGVSRLERWGLPASLGLGLGSLVWLAFD